MPLMTLGLTILVHLHIFANMNIRTKVKRATIPTIFRAFADPTRLRLLHLLRAGELCVCDLVNVLDLPQPAISQHLAYLRKAGLVTARRQGLWAYYQLASPQIELQQKLLDCLDCCRDAMPMLRKDAERLGRCGPSKCCE